ncbi:GAF domain-containing protein [Actinoallomurus bryophytorum]|uniref:GAF domain-containing protein n=2 Tax=Actinoallomurus bryophytorum TaxID=1490222 RepID=A0A543CJB5_9ACTN|nr:GAF domain-containing protein [Actinoallomurus bryophytorum]
MSMPGDQRGLPDVFAQIIGAIIDGDHVARVLELLTRRSVELFDVTSAGIIVVDPRGGYRVVAASDERADLAELFQSFEEEGPALDVLASREPLTVDLACADARWPAFAPAARDVDIRWVHALPIRLGSEVVGALNLFRSEAGGEVPDPGLGQAMCGLVSIALAQERPARRTERLSEHIQQILNDRGRVEQVSGILAAHMGISPGDAHEVLAHHARTSGVTVVKVANDVINGDADPRAIAATWRRGTEPDTVP